MGFYSPHTLVGDAQRHGVQVKPPCVMQGEWDARLEPGSEAHAASWWAGSVHKERVHTPWADHIEGRPTFGLVVQPSVRLGLREVLGMAKGQAEALVQARARRPFENIADLVHRADLPKNIAARLASAGALDCFGVSRRQALWRVMAIERRSPLFAGVELPDEAQTAQSLPPMTATEQMRADYGTLGLSVSTHPMTLVRAEMRRRGVIGFLELNRTPHGTRVKVGGLAVTRQRPGTASGVIFMTLEDEDGHMNLIVFTKVYETYRTTIRDSAMLIAGGQVQRIGEVVNLIVQHFEPMNVADPGVMVSRNYF